MGHTMAEKLIGSRVADAAPGGREVWPDELVEVLVDIVLANDITAPIAIREFERLGADEVFDPDRVRDRATFEQPHQYAEGFSLVVVNGQVVFDGKAMTAARPGRVLYRAR